MNQLWYGDCFELLKWVPAGSVGLVLTDPPYGVTKLQWDCQFDLTAFWSVLLPTVRPTTPVLITGTQPFTSQCILSNLKMFRYEWIWHKTKGGGFITANKMPMKRHENVMVFYQKAPLYQPIKTIAAPEKVDRRKTLRPCPKVSASFCPRRPARSADDGTRFPESVLKFSSVSCGVHPTQKPLGLLEYFIQTYTRPGDLVLDPFAGSGSTLVAAKRLGRRFLGIEQSPEYCEIARQRLQKEA